MQGMLGTFVFIIVMFLIASRSNEKDNRKEMEKLTKKINDIRNIILEELKAVKQKSSEFPSDDALNWMANQIMKSLSDEDKNEILKYKIYNKELTVADFDYLYAEYTYELSERIAQQKEKETDEKFNNLRRAFKTYNKKQQKLVLDKLKSGVGDDDLNEKEKKFLLELELIYLSDEKTDSEMTDVMIGNTKIASIRKRK